MGLPCPQCHGATEVTDSRPSSFNEAPSIRRRRICRSCGHAFTTKEIGLDQLEAMDEFEDRRRKFVRVLAPFITALQATDLKEILRCPDSKKT